MPLKIPHSRHCRLHLIREAIEIRLMHIHHAASFFLFDLTFPTIIFSFACALWKCTILPSVQQETTKSASLGLSEGTITSLRNLEGLTDVS